MEFICVSCQVRMVAGEPSETGEPGGSLLAFGCPSCGHALALRVTSLEAALVRTLGMTVPGLTATAAPSTAPSPAGGAPNGPRKVGGRDEGSPRLLWSEEAAAALLAVPAAQQAIVKRTVESVTRARGASRVTAALLAEVTTQINLEMIR